MENPFLLPSKVYDILTKIVGIVLPGLGTLYFALASIWGWGGAEQVVGTLAAVAVFLSLILGLSNRLYEKSGAKYDGEFVVGSVDGAPQGNILLDTIVEPTDALGQKELRLKVKDATNT